MALRKPPYEKPAEWTGGIADSASPHLWSELKIYAPWWGGDTFRNTLKQSPFYSEFTGGGPLRGLTSVADYSGNTGWKFRATDRGLALINGVKFYMEANADGLWGTDNLDAMTFMWCGKLTSSSAQPFMCGLTSNGANSWAHATSVGLSVDTVVSGQPDVDAIRFRHVGGLSSVDFYSADASARYLNENIVVVAIAGGAGTGAMWINGEPQLITTLASDALNIAPGTNGANLLAFFNNMTGDSHAAGVWNRALDPDEIQQISVDPWAPIRTKRSMRLVYSADAPAGSTAIGIASENDAAQTLSATIAAAVGVSSEQDAAQTLSASIAASVGVPSEQDAAQTLGATIAAAIGVSSELDGAQALASPNAFTLAREVDTALPLSSAIVAALSAAVENNAALTVSGAIVLAPGVASENDAAIGLHLGSVGIASELDSAQALTAAGSGIDSTSLDYTLDGSRLHYSGLDGRLHYRLGGSRLHYTIEG